MPAASHGRIAEEIAGRIKRQLCTALPSIARLAEEHRSSPVTVWKALHLLEQRGLVKCRKGRSTVVISKDGAIAPGVWAGDTAAHQLCAEIRAGILDGTYAVERPLPKFDFFTLSRGIGRTTVARAFRLLAGERMCYKKGKPWIAGPPSRGINVKGGIKRARGVVLSVVSQAYDWYNMVAMSYANPFIVSCTGELLKHGLRLSLVQQSAAGDLPSPIPAGIDTVRSLVRTLGEDYHGAIIVANPAQLESMADWVAVLSPRGRCPVVLIDASDIDAACVRSRFPHSRRYYRLFVDESAAVELALATLVHDGHRRIGLPLMKGYAVWPERRLALARRACAAHADVSIVSATHDEPFWDLGTDTANFDRFIRFDARVLESMRRRHGGSASRRGPSPAGVRPYLLSSTPSMTSLLRAGVTALVSLNDTVAREQYLWCNSTGIAVPRDLSIVSFDNSPEAAVLPISTIDFGLAGLGYCAAHILIDDIPAHADREGNIAGTCTLVDRGSTGPARTSARLLNLMGKT
jgi:DNA-binding LacI/PurR family transcriptional regulator/DNA-binding transcriptional regulator YhcF (GntR family)